jgi:hypothetical protein
MFSNEVLHYLTMPVGRLQVPAPPGRTKDSDAVG